VGMCKITASAPGNNTYSAASVTQSLSVLPAVLTVTANAVTISYGQQIPTSFGYTYSGFVGTDTASSVLGTEAPALSTTATSTSNAGTYPITVATGSLAATNYAFLYVPGTLTIKPASQTITFAPPTSPVTYGVSPITLTATGGASGIPVVFSIDPSSTGTGTITGNTLKVTGAGTLVIDANQAGNTNYQAAPQVHQTIVVSQATLTVTANNASRAYGVANPTFTASYMGFVNGDTSVPGSPSLTTTATASSLPGPYTITAAQGSLTSPNYTFKFVNGTLTVSFTASVPVSGSACNGAYNGTFKGNLTVASGQTCVFVGGGATGNLTESGGNIVLSGATIGGSITITGGTFSIGPSTSVTGNLQIQNIATGSATNQVCATTIGGSLQFQSNGTSVLIGSGSPSCAGNVIKGSLQVLSNTAAVTIDANTVSSSLQVQSNSAAVTMDGNKITGSLQVQSNAGATTVDTNTVGGSLQDQSNTGATQVFSNVISGTLQCQSNTSITGGGNTAASKQGQCAKF
jgi:hypothetical protein